MTYLDAAIARMRLPIHVEYLEDDYDGTWAWLIHDGRCGHYTFHEGAATAAYFDLVSSLTNPATSSPAGNLGGCSANSSTPEGVGM
jgi:hypothetical protein